jgi:deoxyribonuclease V
MRLVVTDVHYQSTAGCAAAVVADAWEAQFPSSTHAALVMPVADYEPGAFWRRELPCLQAVLDGLAPTLVVVDGYVWLDADGRKGLGAHLHEALGVPVVGVAKTAFDGSAHAREVLRGVSARPLWVTAVGVDVDEAAAAVGRMHGPHRLPTLLQLADGLARAGRAR